MLGNGTTVRILRTWLCVELLLVAACSTPAHLPPPERAQVDEVTQPYTQEADTQPVTPDSTAEEPAPPDPEVDTSGVTREDLASGEVRLTFQPPNMSVSIPIEMRYGAVLRGRELSRLDECETTYSPVVNASLPIAALRAHAQADDLCQTMMVDGVHLRVYVLDEPLSHVARAIRNGAAAEIANIPPSRARATTLQEHTAPGRWTSRTRFRGWTHVFVSYARGDDDSGESVVMDFFLRRFGEHTVVFAVMHHDGLVSYEGEVRIDSIASLITSVRSQ
jgi:hypothetical protein